MSVELHLPDLPQVPISIGAALPPRPGMPWAWRLRELLLAYLPLLLMAALALAIWWLVKQSPHTDAPGGRKPVSAEPDYSMTQFAVERFDAQGRLTLRIEGARMRHYPATDRIEVEDAHIRAIGQDGRVMLAHARTALGNGDGSELQLMGGAEVSSSDANGAPMVMRSEFLHAFMVAERVKSYLPVLVQTGQTELRATGLDYDHAAQRLVLAGPIHAELAPHTARAR